MEKVKQLAVTKRKYRTEIGIVYDMLCEVMDAGYTGIPISKLCSKANCSFYDAKEKCSLLEHYLLIESVDDSETQFRITENGRLLHHEIEEFKSIVNSYSLRI